MDAKLELVSWASPDDPTEGEFRFQHEADQYIIKNRSIDYWKSGVSDDFISDDILPTISSLLLNTTRNGNYNRNIPTSSSSSKTNMNIRLVMNSNGTLQYFTRVNVSARWVLSWLEPQDPCNVFEACGNFASCNSKNKKSMCECLPGFEPILPDNWNSGDFSEGCLRRVHICSNKQVEKNQIFRSLKVIKVGEADVNSEANSENECKEECLNKCNCQAYSFEVRQKSQLRGVVNKTCWIWSDVLNNIQFNSTDGVHVINLRVGTEANETKQGGGHDESNKQFKQWPLAFAVTVAIVIALAFIVFYIYKRKAKVKKQDRARDPPPHFYDDQRHVKELIDSKGLNDEDKKGIDLPFFDFESILAATDNFSEANKLGKGGFGLVYKGNFPGGQEIAVKRLSRVSGQGEEKILLYEFMPNKSLDSFIFDPNLGKQTEGATNRVVGTYGYMSPESFEPSGSRMEIVARRQGIGYDGPETKCSATATLPTPKRPAFVNIVVRRRLNSMASSSSSKTETNNEITVTLQGR
ncbi:hypothetical protein QYF36_021404 [Acer negundo]|nr:hypothetical protein QYF36_021404 [Acer negundo]